MPTIGKHNTILREGKHMTYDQLTELYLGAGKLEGKTDMTLIWYRRRFGQFRPFLVSREHSLLIADLRLADGTAYLNALMDQTERWIDHPRRKNRKDE